MLVDINMILNNPNHYPIYKGEYWLNNLEISHLENNYYLIVIVY